MIKMKQSSSSYDYTVCERSNDVECPFCDYTVKNYKDLALSKKIIVLHCKKTHNREVNITLLQNKMIKKL